MVSKNKINNDNNRNKIIKLLIDSVIIACFGAFIIYYCITNLNSYIVTILENLANNPSQILEFTFLFFIIFFIISFICKMGFFIINLSDKKK